MINCPIIHVNGDDTEAVVRAARACIQYRQQFGRDVVLASEKAMSMRHSPYRSVGSFVDFVEAELAAA